MLQGGLAARAPGKHLRQPFEQQPLPCGHLVRMKLAPRRDRLHAVPLAQRLERYPCLELRREPPSLPGHLGASSSALESTLTTCPKNRDHLTFSRNRVLLRLAVFNLATNWSPKSHRSWVELRALDDQELLISSYDRYYSVDAVCKSPVLAAFEGCVQAGDGVGGDQAPNMWLRASDPEQNLLGRTRRMITIGPSARLPGSRPLSLRKHRDNC